MTTTTPSMVRNRDDADASWFFNALVTTVAATPETGGAYNLTEHLVTAASNPPVHVQVDEDEAFYIVDGTVEFEVDGTTSAAEPGTFAFVARGCAHTFRVLTPTARMLVICSGKASDNLHEFFLDMGEPAPVRELPVPGAPDLEKLDRLCARTGIELVG